MKRKLPTYVFLLFVTASCVYTVSPDSFKEQYIKSGSETKKTTSGSVPLNIPQQTTGGVVAGVLVFDLLSAGFSGTKTYEVNRLKSILAKDKNGEEVIVDEGYALEARVITKSGKRYYFLLHRIILKNDTLSGTDIKFYKPQKLPLDSVERLEITRHFPTYK